jgi:hypothetical protein
VSDLPSQPTLRPPKLAGFAWHWALCVVFAVAAVLCISWEPVRHDGWYIWLGLRVRPWSFDSLVDVIRFNYWHGNPRFGENVTYTLYAQGWWHIAIHAALLVCSLWVLCVIALGRRPRREDALLATTLIAMYLIAIPRVGPMLFYRPFFGNYVVGALPSFALLAMFRCKLRSSWLVVPAFVLGALGGMGNEHTGPAFVMVAIFATYLAWRRRDMRPWMIAAVVGLTLGFIALFFAPGQMERYAGAAKVGIAATITSRSWFASLRIVARGPMIVFWLTPWIIIAAIPQLRNTKLWVHRSEAKPVAIALSFSIVVGGTLLASPLNGPRLYYACAALLVATAAAWVVVELNRKQRIALAVINSLVIIVSSVGLVSAAWRERPAFAHRMDLILAAQPGTALVVPPIANGFRQWTLGDDFVDQALRNTIAATMRLTSVDVGAR